MRDVCRALRRLLLVGVLTYGLVALRLCLLPARMISPRLDARGLACLMRWWGSGLCAALGVRIGTKGTPPRAPFVLVTNHLSYLDVLVLAAGTGCSFVSRADVARWPLAGFIARVAGTLFIDRANRRDVARVNSQIVRALREGYGVHIFAEGGISQDGRLRPFKPPLLEPAVTLGMPVHAARISYSLPPGRPPFTEIVVWRTGISFLKSAWTILREPRIDAAIHYAASPVGGLERRELANALGRLVADLAESHSDDLPE